MRKKSLLSRITGIFTTSSDDLYEQDKASITNIPKGNGSANPLPVTSKAVHAGMVYNPSLSSRNGEELYTPAEYNLSTVANAYDTDSYFRRAVEKYVELIWKAGYSFYGKNPNAVAYIRKRFEQIALVTSIPTDQLFRDISYQLVQYSNVYISKVRNTNASGGRPRVDFTGVIFQPIAGYFVEDSVSMYLAVKDNGDVIGYKQMMRGVYNMTTGSTGGYPVGQHNSNYYKVWKPANMIHMVHSRKPGIRVGTPMVMPVMDDIRALRRIEQNVELLVFQHTIPLFHYKIGSNDRPAQPDEIFTVRQTVERMPPNGCLVTPERHEIKAVGVEGALIDASPYLEYYKNRVLAGLGMSSVAMGEGGTSNKGTAIVLDKHLVNTTSMYQQVLKMYVDEFMIKELLAEGGFDTSWVNEDNKVSIVFPPIDAEEQRTKENHYAQMYNQNAITEDEMRKEMGKEPLSDKDRKHLFVNLVSAKEKVAGATTKAINSGSNKNTPTNQHGKLGSKPNIPKNDEIEQLVNIIKYTKSDLIDTCIDATKDGVDVFDKLDLIKRTNFEVSKDNIMTRKEASSLDNKAIYDVAIGILNDMYTRFVSLKHINRVDVLANKIGSFTDVITDRLTIHVTDNEVSV